VLNDLQKNDEFSKSTVTLFTAHSSCVGDFILHPRVVLFSDGKLTDFCNANSSDSEADLSHNVHVSTQKESHKIFSTMKCNEYKGKAVIHLIETIETYNVLINTATCKY
jgi:hypothetical protein